MIQIPTQEVITRDNISIGVDAMVYADVASPTDAVLRVEQYMPATLQLAATTLRTIIGRMERRTVADHWTCAGVVGRAGAPSIALTVVPPLGKSDPIQGTVSPRQPRPCYAVTYIHVGGAGWWVKPGTTTRRTIVRCDGTFANAYATGGNDVNADQFSTYLVPADTTRPSCWATPRCPRPSSTTPSPAPP